MDGELFLNSAELERHKEFVLQEKYLARRLQDNIDSIWRMAPDTVTANRDMMRQFQQLSERVETAVQFYSALYGAVDNIELETENTSRKIGLLLEDYQADMSKMTIFNTSQD